MALCLYGQQRTEEFCAPSLNRHLISRYCPDVFICSEGNPDTLRENYQPVAMEIYSPEEKIRAIGGRFDRYGETWPNPGPFKEHPIKPKADLLYLYQGWRCREMLRDREEKYGSYDIIVSSRFDIKYLKIQPIKKPKKNTFYVPRVDAFGQEAVNGIHWGMGLSTHTWWADSITGNFMLNSYNWFDDCFKEIKNWCGQAMTKYMCDKMKIKVEYTDVTCMLIRGTNERPLEGLPPWLPLSEKIHPEYLPQEWEKKKTNKKTVPVKEPPHAVGFNW